MTDATTTTPTKDIESRAKNKMNLTEVAKATRKEALLRQICDAFSGTQSPSLQLLLDRIRRNEWLCYGDMLTLSSTLWRIKIDAGEHGSANRKDVERIMMEKKLQRRKNMLKTKLKQQVFAQMTVNRIKEKV